MKIAVLIDTWFPFVGGGQINAWEISTRLAQKGQKIEIITRNCGKEKRQSTKNLKIVKFGQPSKPLDDFSRFRYLINALIYVYKGDFDLIIAHAFLPGLVAKLLMTLKNKHTVFVVHGTSIGTDLNKGFKAQLEKFILTKIRYSAQVTVSQDFFKIKNVNKNIVYIPNGINPVFLKSRKPLKRLKNTLLFVGRLHPQKNLINLIEAIKILKDKNNPVTLKIVGEGLQRQELLNLVKKYKLQNQISLEGPKTKQELVSYYQTSTVLILPSIYEGQPLTLLEAWASRLPVIVSKTGDYPYLVKEGNYGFLIEDQFKPSSIAEAIKKALNNKNLSKIGSNSSKFATENFSWEKSSQITLQLCKNLVKQ